MYRYGVVCFFLVASIESIFTAQMTESQRAKIYGNLLTGGMECMKDFPLTLDHITAFRNKKVPQDEVASCFSHCLYKKLGLMDNSGKLSEKKALKEAKKIFQDDDEMLTKVEELVGKCKHVNDAETSDGEKGCERAKLLTECFIEHAVELGFDVEF